MRWNYPLTSASNVAPGQFSNVNDLDDEDLARQQQQQQSSNFISGHSAAGPQTKPSATNDAASTGTNNNNNNNYNLDDDEEAPFRWKQLFPVDGDDERPFLGLLPDNVATSDGTIVVNSSNNNIEDNIDNNDSLSASMMMAGSPENIRPHNNHHHHHNHNRAGRNGLALAAADHQQQQQNGIGGANDKHPDSLGSSQVVGRLGGRLAKLVHKIAPELSCYTSMGEHYRGSLAQIADGRQCSSWFEIRQHLQLQLQLQPSAASISAVSEKAAFIFRAVGAESASGKLDDIHHNHCRNPTMDPRGPWCFVQYERELDLGLATATAAAAATAHRAPILISSGVNGTMQLPPRYIQRHCPVGPCSEYLWLYIVAPPLGLLIVLSCLITLLVRYIRRKVTLGHHHCGYSASRRSKSLRCGIRKLLLANGGKFAPKKFTSSSSAGKSSSCGRYLDDDIFEIVDDIDWSDGTNQSLSPKSQESLKLSLAATSGIGADYDSDRSGGGGGGKHRLTGATSNSRIATQQLGVQRASKFGQVGPVFATLRCQARNNLKSVSQVQGNTLSKLNKSTSTFIEQQRSGCKKFSNPSTTSSLSPKSSSLSSPSKDKQQNQSASSATDSGHLISCSSTTEDIDSSASLDYCHRGGEKCTNACDLPLISADSISIAVNQQQQQQPLYEGKFSQVQLAFVKRSKGKDPLRNKSADIGAQVALCALKSSANTDFESIFEPTSLKVRNLNHLNLLKLIGYSTDSRDEFSGQLRQTSCCMLVYDMGQLVDLSDWLRQQSKDIMMSCEPSGELGTRRNLTCFAKQVALALDYLHDKGIVYKDLACRNCFLDPTKMLVKLASFNQEFVGATGNQCNETATTDDQLNSLRSMIRPKYLLDYYVIDSRPSDSQLLPLSWIPLESILFNKFNMQTDVWSFGCLLYELFSLGEVAYFGYSSKQVIDAVRSNLMPPQPLLCPNGIYKLMCKCLSDIPSMRPNVKQIYEQLNLYSGQCSSFLDHHLCSLAGCNADSGDDQPRMANHQLIVSTSFKTTNNSATPHATTSPSGQGSISKTKSYANIKNYRVCDSDPAGQDRERCRPEVTKIPLSKSINLTSSRLMTKNNNPAIETNHYDEPVVDLRK